MNYKLINMKVFGDERGKLVSLEGGMNCSFEIKRVYYIFDTLPDQERGKHAHKELEQIIVANRFLGHWDGENLIKNQTDSTIEVVF